ncbi:MAG: tyrosine-type recombinase/integrase [Bacteroidia bacterium]
MAVQITLFLDTRRPKVDGLYPLKVRIWDGFTRKAKLYRAELDLLEKDFESAWLTQRPRREALGLRERLDIIKTRAQEAASDLEPFTFEAFEKKLYRKAGDGLNIIYHYDKAIEEFNLHGQVGTASTYELSLKSIYAFLEERTGKQPVFISFYEVNIDWLKGYEDYMVKSKNKSYTTVSMYLRVLRTIFNRAIAENEIKLELYPFGKRKYQIPATQKVKKALSQEQLRILFKARPKTPEQSKAKDFWFFSYSCNGMNMKDIALLKYKDIYDDAVHFYRAKTITTSRANMKMITAYLSDFAKKVIKKYETGSNDPEDYLFDIVSKEMNPIQQRLHVQYFTRYVNQHLRKLCNANKLPEISTYWARHSFATNSIRNGTPIEFMQESLGHSSIKTTEGYFAGFDEGVKKEFASKVMNFNPEKV